MSRILLWSDAHIHMHKNMSSRLDDGLKVLDWIFNTAIKENIEVLVFAGDLFQDRHKIHTISYEKTFNLIRKFMEDNPNIKQYFLVGNHDMWFNDKWDVSSISPLEAIKNVTVINRPCTKQIFPGFDLDFLPYTKNPLEDIKHYFKNKSKVLVSHISIDGAQLNGMHNTKAEVSVEFEGDMTKVSIDNFCGWEKVWLGHYHTPQKLNDVVEYIGSPYELNFGEAHQQKHIIIFDTNDFKCKYIPNNFSPKHLIISEKNIDKFNLQNNFIQIIVDDISSANIIDVRKKIINENKIASLEFKEKKIIKKESDQLNAQEKFDFANGEILEKYMFSVSDINLDKDKLLLIGKSLINDVNCEII